MRRAQNKAAVRRADGAVVGKHDPGREGLKRWVVAAVRDGTDLRGARLTQADLSRCDLTGAKLQDATLRGADLREATLTGATLRGADLRHADLSGAIVVGVDMCGCQLAGARVGTFSRVWQSVDVRNADTEYAFGL